MNKVVIIYGPTAVGKSSIAIELAKQIDGEIISADSMQIYKHLNIGSAKVSLQDMQGIKHHLIDIKEPYEDYSVSDFCEDAKKAIKDILSRKKTPIIVGGTGLYIKALTEGFGFGCKRDESKTNQLSNLSIEELYKRIIQLDKNCDIDKSNKRRLIRRLELLQNKISVKNKGFEYPYVLFGIVDDRTKIYERINNRVDEMVDMGLLEEAEYLFNFNNPNLLAMKAIGYKEFIPYFNGTMTLNQCKDILKQKTRNYAKRQFTFLNQFKNINLISFNGIIETANKIKNTLENNNG